ncbi:MAG TPA: hypothetical protein VGL15_05235 [Vicinamibacteria bacterium]|jgi:hypothetical protein
MTELLLEYLGFRATAEGRDYFLRARHDDQRRSYTITIAQEAFTAGRARFQDGPELSYLKLRDELAAHGNAPPIEDTFLINDAELAAYREARTRQPARRKSAPERTPADRPGR